MGLIPLFGQIQPDDHSYCCSNKYRCRFNAQSRFFYKNSAAFTDYGYDIIHLCFNLRVNPQSGELIGSVTYHYKAIKDSLRQVTFDAYSNITIDSVKRGRFLMPFQRTNNLVTVDRLRFIRKGVLDTLTLFYKAQPVPDELKLEGYSVSPFAAMDTKDGSRVVWTLSQPYGAPAWWPAKMSLDDKADSVDFFIETPALYTAVSHGYAQSRNSTPHNTVIHHYKHRIPIALYLLAFAVSKYHFFLQELYAPKFEQVIPIENYVYLTSFEDAKRRLKRYEQALVKVTELLIPYPFEKYGHAQTNFPGGIEHQTISFMGNFEFPLVIHEYVHQWFGNLVTCGSWQDLWLNESLATYMEGWGYKFLEQGYWWPKFQRGNIATTISKPDGAVYAYPQDTITEATLFDRRLRYIKGAAVINQLNWLIGDSAFWQGIRGYLSDTNLAYKFAKTPDLKRHLEAAAQTDLTDYFNRWVYGEGFPTYYINYRQTSPNQVGLRVEQRQSLPGLAYFKMRLPLRLYGKDSLGLQSYQDFSVENFVNGQSYTLNHNLFEVDSLILDPESVLIMGNPVYNGLISSRYTSKPLFNLKVTPSIVQIGTPVQVEADYPFEQIIVLNVTGQQVLQAIRPTLQTQNLTPGVYQVGVCQHGVTYYTKLVVTH